MSETFMQADKTTIDKFMYSQFIKYEDLDKVMDYLCPKGEKIINIYIDLYSMTTSLYRYYKFENPLSLTACMVNSAIHYRNYFRKRGTYTNIFLIYSPTMSPNNTRFCPTYNMGYTQRILNNPEVQELVHKNLELLGVISPYLPDIFFRMGTVEVSVIIADMILNFANKMGNPISLIVSTSPLAYQIPILYNRSAVLHYKSINRSLIIGTIKNALDIAIQTTKNIDTKDLQLDQTWLSGYYTLCGISKRNIKTLVSHPIAMKIFNILKESQSIMAPETLFDAYLKILETKKTTKIIQNAMDKIYNRFRCIDLKEQLNLYQLMPEAKETTYLGQLKDSAELYSINQKYFRDNPMSLDKL